MPQIDNGESGASVRAKINASIALAESAVQMVQGLAGPAVSLTADDIPDGTTHVTMTAAERTKLAGIEAGAQVNTVASVAGLTGTITAAALRAAINVEDGATADQTGQEIVALIDGYLGSTDWRDAAAEVVTGSGAPASAPPSVGAIYVDTANGRAYVATGTAAATDWEIVTPDVPAAPGSDALLGYDLSAGQDVYYTLAAPLSISGTAVTVGAASTTAAGVVELATVAEADAGSSTTLAVTPAGLASRIRSDPTGVTGADQITNVISLTQAEYDAIATPDPATLYVITG